MSTVGGLFGRVWSVADKSVRLPSIEMRCGRKGTDQMERDWSIWSMIWSRANAPTDRMGTDYGMGDTTRTLRTPSGRPGGEVRRRGGLID